MILSMVLIPTVNVAVVFGGFFSSGFVGRGGGGFYGFCFRWWWWWVVEIEREEENDRQSDGRSERE